MPSEADTCLCRGEPLLQWPALDDEPHVEQAQHAFAQSGDSRFVLTGVLNVPSISYQEAVGIQFFSDAFGRADKLPGVVIQLQALLYAGLIDVATGTRDASTNETYFARQ
jgi:hypothetical protein